MGILADIEVILQARSARAAWQHYAGSLSDMGFVHACYFGVRSLGAEIDGGSDDSILLSTFAPQLNQDLAAQGMAPGAAPVGWLAGGYCSESWAGLQSRRRAGRLSAQQANLLDVLARYGHVAGYALRLDDSMQHARAGVLLSGHIGIRAEQIDEMWLRHGAAVETLTRLLHLKLSCLPYAPPQQVLTLRQREVLEHISIGRTVQEIALRSRHPAGHVWTFWDYQAGGWQRDHGFRIDHLLLSPAMADRLVDAQVDKDYRGREKASDHAPTWALFR